MADGVSARYERGVTPAYVSMMLNRRYDPSRALMDAFAAVLNLPDGGYAFLEYRLAEARDRLDPRRAGLEAAAAELAKLEMAQIA